jgi:copper resistance protein C
MITGLKHRAAMALLLCLAGADRAALAHAIVLESAPAVDASVVGPDVDLRLRFNSRIDHRRSRMVLVFPDKTPRPLTAAAGAGPDTLSAHAAGLAPGPYELSWQVLAVDGHITRGQIPFRVIARPSAGTAAGARR